MTPQPHSKVAIGSEAWELCRHLLCVLSEGHEGLHHTSVARLKETAPTPASGQGHSKVALDSNEALRSIIVRCEEGDPRTDWLPTIAKIARDALCGEWPSPLQAAEYELCLYRLWADSPVNDVTEGGLVERVRRHLELFRLEPHVCTTGLKEFDRRQVRP